MFTLIKNLITVQFSYTQVIKDTLHCGNYEIAKKKKRIECYLNMEIMHN